MSNPVANESGRELVPAPWTVTEREKQLLEGVDLSAFPSRAREVFRQAQGSTGGIAATTEGFRSLRALFETKAGLRKAINDEYEEERRGERLAGEETEIAKLRRENFRLKGEAARAQEEAGKQARLKEIAIAHKEGGQ